MSVVYPYRAPVRGARAISRTPPEVPYLTERYVQKRHLLLLRSSRTRREPTWSQGSSPVARSVLVYGRGSHYSYYGFLNAIPTQLPCERRSSKPKPAAQTASAASSARATTEPLAARAPPRRRAARRGRRGPPRR